MVDSVLAYFISFNSSVPKVDKTNSEHKRNLFFIKNIYCKYIRNIKQKQKVVNCVRNNNT